MTPQRALLAGVVDYAGLFPPAALDIAAAVGNFVSYRADPASWMLGRFVAPADRLDDVLAVWAMLADPNAVLRISATLGSNIDEGFERVHRFNAHARGAVVDSAEVKLASVTAVPSAAQQAGRDLAVFAEIPTSEDPISLVRAIARGGINAKIRTGGITEDAFPPPADIIRFMRQCIDEGVAFKATAGLHHPLRSEYRLTYAEGAACGSMYGFLNVFLAAGFIAKGVSDDVAERMLLERDPKSIEWLPDEVRWRNDDTTRALDTAALRHLRETIVLSFGSCSFREPVDELRAIKVIE